MNEVTPELLAKFRERVKLSDDEDENLTDILEESIADLIEKCGEYDVHADKRFRELVFNRARYAYNDAIEYFNDNFLSQITTLAISKVLSSSSTVEGDTSEEE